MRYALFWDLMLLRVVNMYRRFMTTYQSHCPGLGSPRRILKSRYGITTLLHKFPEQSRSHIQFHYAHDFDLGTGDM
jgi:hypothetical protein